MRFLNEPAHAAVWSASVRREAGTVGFVPTMGALHQGHLALVASALQQCDQVAVSIFVNPLQFNNIEDLQKYPRQLESDTRLLRGVGCHAVFVPTDEELFADFTPVEYGLGELDAEWEGSSRPGHFQGVVNVVERLFHFVRPDRAFFGEKDRQQVAIIDHVARNHRWPERIIRCPTLREADGLAMSSRNQRLGPKDREHAPLLFKALQAVAERSTLSTVGDALNAGRAVLREAPTIALDYLGIAEPRTLRPLRADDRIVDGAVALIAAQVGPVRLIDNLTLRPS